MVILTDDDVCACRFFLFLIVYRKDTLDFWVKREILEMKGGILESEEGK